MAFITDAQLSTQLAGVLKLANGSSDLVSSWTEIISKSNASAYNNILSRLMARGFTKAQIDSWDDGESFNIDIGLYWCLVKGAGLHGYDDKFIARLDRRDELDEVTLIDGSTILEPEQTYGDPSYGDLDDSNDQVRRDRYVDGELEEKGTEW